MSFIIIIIVLKLNESSFLHQFDVNAEILNGRKGLHYASDYGHVKVIEYLCSRGAKVNVSSVIALTPVVNR